MDPEKLFKSGKMPPMMEHWYSIRKKYPQEDHIIAYRMGDFYEFFYDDAKMISNLLGLTLSARGKGASRAPLAGIPHKATQHFKSLIKQGITVVVVEQLEDPKNAQGQIVKRGVVRILSPGTIIDEDLLDSKENNYLCAIFEGRKKGYGVAFVELSTAEFFCTEYLPENKGDSRFESVLGLLGNYNPVECLLPLELYNDLECMDALSEASRNMVFKQASSYAFSYDSAYRRLCEQFSVKNLDGFGLKDRTLAIQAAGAILQYLQDTQKTFIHSLLKISYLHATEDMFLDLQTQKNLELLHNMADGGKFGTLFSILDRTVTPMGTRRLKTQILQPMTDLDKIQERLEAVDALFLDSFSQQDVRNLLGGVGDLHRTITRINYYNSANARDLIQLKNSLEVIPKIQKILQEIPNETLNHIATNLLSIDPLIEFIEKTIVPNPPTTITEGEIIKAGYSKRLDEYRTTLKGGETWFENYEQKIKKLLDQKVGVKVGFNRVLGYYIQVTKHTLTQVEKHIPETWQKKQTLTNSVRFFTEDLKEMELKVLEADEKIKELEYQIFQEIRKRTVAHTLKIQQNAEYLARIDIISTFAEISMQYNYVKPIMTESPKIDIEKGRHPVIEQINRTEPFVPNDIKMDSQAQQIYLVTGPNWSGKSTYLRQNALIVLMAQLGCFIPADSGEIGIVDRIFTRIGASDDLTRGQSTFLMEMNETANILNNVTEKSLIIIDELGRGTSTIDGQAIARAVIEKLHAMHVKTLFSTHFHELVNLNLDRMVNYHFKILEQGRKLIFLRELTLGGTDKSYGVHVAEMAGVPLEVIERSFELVDIYSQLNPFNNITRKSQKLSKDGEISSGHNLQRKKHTENLPQNAQTTETIQRLKATIHRLEKELHEKDALVQMSKDKDAQTTQQKLKAINQGLEKEIANYCERLNELEKNNTELLKQIGQTYQKTATVVPRDSKVSLGPTMELNDKNKKRLTKTEISVENVKELKEENIKLNTELQTLQNKMKKLQQVKRASSQKKKNLVQSMLFVPAKQEKENASVLDKELAKLNINDLTPLAALNLIQKWKKFAKEK